MLRTTAMLTVMLAVGTAHAQNSPKEGKDTVWDKTPMDQQFRNGIDSALIPHVGTIMVGGAPFPGLAECRLIPVNAAIPMLEAEIKKIEAEIALRKAALAR